MDLRGSLRATDLPMLVRFLATFETSGRLRITLGDRWGDLYLEDGRITAAAFGEARGLPALDAIAVELRDGRFTYDRGLLPTERELDLTPEALRARLGARAGPAAAPESANAPNGNIAAGAAAARVLREQLRPLPTEAPPPIAATALPPLPTHPPRPRPRVGGRAALAVLAGLFTLGAVAGGVLRTTQHTGGPPPSRAAPGSSPVATAAGAAPSAAPGVIPSVAPAASVPPAAAPASPAVPAAPSLVAGVTVTATASGPAALTDRVAAAEAALRSGRFEVTVGITETSRSTATVLFDLGDAAGGTGTPRLRMTSTYTGTAGTQTTEHVVVGERAWDRQADGRWVAVPPVHGPWDQVTGLLPRAGTATDPEVTTGPDGTVLRWYEAGFNADLTLRVDTATGVPREFRRAARATGIVLTVAYSGWNVPVDIAPPQS